MNLQENFPEVGLFKKEHQIAIAELNQLRSGLGVARIQFTSMKCKLNNLLYEQEDVLIFADSGHTSGEKDESQFNFLRLQPLRKLASINSLPGEQIVNELACSRLDATREIPALEAVLHAALPFTVVLSAQSRAVMAIARSRHGPENLEKVYGDSIQFLSNTTEGLSLAGECLQALRGNDLSKTMGLILPARGMLVFGATPQLAYQYLVELIKRAADFIGNQLDKTDHSQELFVLQSSSEPASSSRQSIASLRKTVSNAAGRPLVLTCRTDPLIRDLMQDEGKNSLLFKKFALANTVQWTRWQPMFGRDVESYMKEYTDGYQDNHLPIAPPSDIAPRVVLDPELGLCVLGKNKAEALYVESIYRDNLAYSLLTNTVEQLLPLPDRELLVAERVAIDIEQILTTYKSNELQGVMFQGEVALVTGGASGIGKACVEALLKHGAAVVSLDINPVVKTCFDSPEYLGLVCDLTAEAAILEAFETFTRYFGGLDMLVLNAGIFPAGCRIESLTLAEWQRVMRINLDSNMILLREAYPLLKQSYRGGRVLVNASKNVLAPGAGAAAYSASKAAVTQMARVAALEWGKDHIRVNMIHPDAVFDTGIWTEEVIQARAAHYGLTVQQYKTRNILGVELNSHFVAELVVEMLGPRFEKITGAQIPVDGGSDRVI
jgi:NAD(P)-dependent dehydrogenase (short-subunit alcohol dehydrogenase family)/rhamnose utilization protein RhaD (predicted bifunctional aldolase and dehydrogenase)